MPDGIDIFNNPKRFIESGEARSASLRAEVVGSHTANDLPLSDPESVPPNNPDESSFILTSIDRVWTGRTDPFVKYPIEMNRHARQLMDDVFDDRYGNTPPFRDAWMPIGMMGPAAFRQVLSSAALNLAYLRARQSAPENLESIRHHAEAVKLVTRR